MAQDKFIEELMKVQRSPFSPPPSAAPVSMPPALTPEGVTFPNLDQLGQQGLAEFNAATPPQEPFDPLSFFEGRASGATAPQTPAASMFAPNPALETMTPDFARQMNVPAEVLTRQSASAAPATPQGASPSFVADRPAGPIVSPPDAIAPSAVTAPPQTVAPQAPSQRPSLGGLITFETGDRAGQSFRSGAEGVTQISPEAAQTLGSQIDTARRERGLDSAAQRLDEAGSPIANAPRVFSDIERENIAAGRPPNVSAAKVQSAQQEEAIRIATAAADLEAQEFGDSMSGQLDMSIADRNMLTEQFRQKAIERNMAAGGAAGTGGLSLGDQIAISKEKRAGREEAREVAAANVEATQKAQESFEQSRNNVRATQDSFEKLKPVAEEIAALSGTAFTEGALGWAASKLPMTTDARQIERLTTQFEGSAFLQGLIEAKGKGATFGALSEREGDRILAQWGEITDPSSSNRQRITAINNMLGSIQRAAERAASDHAERFPDRSTDAADPSDAPAQPSEGQVTTSSGKTYTFK